MSFSWFILFFQLAYYGSQAKRSNYVISNDFYDDSYGDIDDDDAAYDNYAYDYSEYDDSVYDDSVYDDSVYDDYYNQMAYNQYLWNNYVNQMAYNQYVFNQMYQNELVNQYYQQMMAENQYNDYNEYNEYNMDEGKFTDFLKKGAKMVTSVIPKAIATGYESAMKRHHDTLEECELKEDDFKKIERNFALTKGALLDKTIRQKWFNNMVFQLDAIKDMFINKYELKAQKLFVAQETGLLKYISGNGIKAAAMAAGEKWLKVDFEDILDGLFTQLFDAVAKASDLDPPPRFPDGSREPAKPDMDTFDEVLKSVKYTEGFRVVMDLIKCKFLQVSKRFSDSIAKRFEEKSVGMLIRMATSKLAMYLVDKLTGLADDAFKRLEEAIPWTPDMFEAFVKCLKETKGDIKGCFQKAKALTANARLIRGNYYGYY